jgi:hypothetical protein
MGQLVDIEHVVATLARLPHLEILTLHGNPLSRTPFYRDFLVSKIALRQLDGRPVTDRDRSNALKRVKKADGALKIMMNNFLYLLRIDHVKMILF